MLDNRLLKSASLKAGSNKLSVKKSSICSFLIFKAETDKKVKSACPLDEKSIALLSNCSAISKALRFFVLSDNIPATKEFKPASGADS